MYPPRPVYSSTKPSTPATGQWVTNVNLNLDDDDSRRRPNLTRTPSPTPSELKEMKSGAIDWKTMGNWRFWIRKEWAWYYVIVVVILVLAALITIYHKNIVDWLEPATRWLKKTSWGWIVPILVLFVISFPPLFGHEIVAVLCGLVWGLWIGFGIVAAGTFLGEIGNFYAFRYCCAARSEKLEKTKISYACLAKVVREGGFKIALIVRSSAIPGHFTTAIFATCGMNIFVFSLAAILSMPKQLVTVYLGVLLEDKQTEGNQSRIISRVVLAITFLITAASAWYVHREMDKVKPEIIYQRRKARQAKLARATTLHGNDSTDSQIFDANGSETHILLTSSLNRDPTKVHAPQPHRYPLTNSYGYSKADEDLESQESASEALESRNPYHFPGTRQSIDVPWETGGYAQQARQPTFPPPGISLSPQPEEQQWGQPHAVYSSQSPALPPSHPQSSSQLPTGSTPSPFSTVPPYSTPSHHVYEPTGTSYHTAMASESMDDGYYASVQIPHSGNRRDVSNVSEVNIPGGHSGQPRRSPPSYSVDLR
ncbi:hypothetical protein E1B28_003190 [Marasmius oreades]|uniref:Golgi apparatus membrane protein TVP38 n=1 Tax=Marasmius oreades TaxID=181124 RepID=A0A9P7RM29_9AGAR|nr:uncharacterized protein E1B28_003190 [Marasmius oreades]KAG7085643.1 hypothetical protein E1B28_003190 [Marasmius oreades]